MKHSIKTKILCSLLSVLLVMQIVPFSSFAIEESVNKPSSTVLTNNISEETPKIVCEVIDKRTEYSKDFLLEDGSFYSVTSPTPLHTLVNDKWVDLGAEIELTNADSNTDEVIETIQNSAMSSYSLQRSNVYEYEDTSMIVNKLDCLIMPGGGYRFGGKNAILMKPERVGEYIYKNRIVTYAGLSMHCAFDTNSTQGSNPFVNIYEVNYEWSTNSSPAEFGTENKIIDSLELKNTGNNIWDITDLYSRWDQGITENNGFLVVNANQKSLSVSSPFLVVRYIEVQKNDVDFTYHSLDMNDAGVLYINDCTGALRIEQNILGLQSTTSPLVISRTYDSMLPSYANSAGIGFNFNYESKISLSQYYAEWVMLNGDTIRFTPANPMVEEDNYQCWIAVNTINNENNSIELWIDNTEINKLGNSSNTINYKNLYIKANGFDLHFNENGQLTEVNDSTTKSSILSIAYIGSNLNEIQCADGTKIVFDYEYCEDISYNYISKIEAKSSDDVLISKVTFSTLFDYENFTTKHITTFNNEKSVEYVYDFSGHIISASDEKGNHYEFDYSLNDNGTTGNRLVGYRKYHPENNTTNESLRIELPNTYQRKFIDENDKDELIHYDRNYNIIVHKDTEGVYTCAEYDESGIISSYTFGASENEFILNGSFENSNGETISSWYNENISESIGINNEQMVSGSSSLSFTNTNEFFSCTSSQDVMNSLIESDSNQSKQIFEADKTYVIGGWGRVEDAFPKESSFFGIKIFAAPVTDGNVSNVLDDDYVECVSLAFDTCANKKWQFRMQSFKLDADSVIKVKLVCEEQINSLYFDDIILYESKEIKTDLSNVVTSTPIEYSYSNGLISSEILTWMRDSEQSISMGTSYEYLNGKLSEYKDVNNNSTYYSYNSRTGLLTGIGHTKNEDDVIVDIASLKYDADNLLQSTSQVINNVESNQTVMLTTNYTREFGEVVEVEHNGFVYTFLYNSDGTVKSIYTESSSLSSSEYTNNRIDYTYTSDGEISIVDYSNNYRVKHISSEDEIGKTLTIECYKVDSETQYETLIKSYVYNFNNKGEIIQVYDSGTNITIVYDGDDYSIIEADGLLYQKTTDDNGNTVESYTQAYFDDPNNTDQDTITQSPTVTSYGENDVEINTSTVCINKNVDDFVSTFNYTRSSVTDYFNRIVEKETILDYSRPRDLTGRTIVNTEYSYQDLGDNKTSGLVSEYTSTISKAANSNTTTLSSYNRKYEYDHRGNISFVYTETNNVITPKNYYEYDNANQLITEIDFEKQLCAHYIYNAGGNLTAKIYYKYSELVFDVTNRKIITLGSETSRITYGYDNIWTDRLTNYNGTQINYDKMGNPLNFIGIDHDNAQVTGTLEWSGDLLTAFETTDDRYTYQYDANGYRTSKTVYEKEVDSDSNCYWRETYTMRYIWENGVLTGMTYSGLKDDGTRQPEQNINLVYDEEGAPVGYVTMLGVPYYFNKDINENVLSLIYTDGTKLCSFSYDSWGLPKATYHGENILVQAIAKLTAVFCPVTYHGYLYDYETGLYFNKGRCYSPSWGRYLNPEDPISLTESSINPLDANLYLFCNNNTVNNTDRIASWSRNYDGVVWGANGFDVEMSKLFSSRAFCSVFAGQIIKTYGSWDITNGYNYQGMNSLRIASDLFAHCVGKYAKSAINKVNACWGDGWILNNSKSNTICIRNDDENAWKYEKIWFAASALKAYAQKEGIYIVL